MWGDKISKKEREQIIRIINTVADRIIEDGIEAEYSSNAHEFFFDKNIFQIYGEGYLITFTFKITAPDRFLISHWILRIIGSMKQIFQEIDWEED